MCRVKLGALTALLAVTFFISEACSQPAAPATTTPAAPAATVPAEVAAAAAPAVDADPKAADAAAIRKNVDAYVTAFNTRNAKALAALWSPDAISTNPVTDEELLGRSAIEACYAKIFAEPSETKLAVEVEALDFISPNVAIERGIATVNRPDAEPEKTSYAAVHVKQQGQWLLDRVSDESIAPPPEPPPSNYEHLKEIEWLVGSWVNQDDSASIQTDCDWSKNKNFLTRSFAVVVDGSVDASGMQVIGWDGAAKRIRSWVFDSGGGFGEGLWTHEGDKWIVESSGTLADGSKTAGVNIIEKLDDDSYTWESVNRSAAGQILPNVPKVTIVRAIEPENEAEDFEATE